MVAVLWQFCLEFTPSLNVDCWLFMHAEDMWHMMEKCAS